MPDAPVLLDVFSDLACPWCFIGKRRLEKALADEPPGAVEVRWRAYLLQPDLPAEGVDAEPFFVRKFGSAARMRQLFEHVTGVGRGDGIRFAFDRMKRAPNMRLGHQLVNLAGRRGLASEAEEALFRAHFEEGANLSELGEALAAFERHGVAIDPELLRQEVADGEGLEEVAVDLSLAQRLGVTGVPFFLGNGVVGVSGAQEPATLRRLLQVAREKAGAEGLPA